MAVPLDEYSFDRADVVRGFYVLTTTKEGVENAIYDLHAKYGKVCYLGLTEPKLQAVAAEAQSLIKEVLAMKQNNASYFDIYTRAVGVSSLLEKNIEVYNKSKEGSERVKADYASASKQFDANIKKGTINSGPLNFSNITRQPPIANPKSSAPLEHRSFGYKPEIYQGELRVGLFGIHKADWSKSVQFLPEHAIIFMLEHNPSIYTKNKSKLSTEQIIQKVASHFADQSMPASGGVLESNVRMILHRVKQDYDITGSSLGDLEPALVQALKECHFDRPSEKK